MHDADIGPRVAIVALLAGGALGLFFFGGLWWTVQRAAAFRHPGLAVCASLLLRTGVTLLGFLLVAGGVWQRWGLCLLGFVAARLFVARAVRSATTRGRHAPQS
jgi:F1F0 ATPase subunit 2